jgi:WD40 repeat protein
MKKVISFSGSAGGRLVGDISGDNKLMAAEKIFSNSITVWDIATKKELKTLARVKPKLSEVIFSSCTKYLGVVCEDSSIIIWEIESGDEVKRLKGKKKSLEEAFKKL